MDASVAAGQGLRAVEDAVEVMRVGSALALRFGLLPIYLFSSSTPNCQRLLSGQWLGGSLRAGRVWRGIAGLLLGTRIIMG